MHVRAPVIMEIVPVDLNTTNCVIVFVADWGVGLLQGSGAEFRREKPAPCTKIDFHKKERNFARRFQN